MEHWRNRARRLAAGLRQRLRGVLPVRSAGGAADAGYADRLRAELDTFADQVDVHALPEIFHYWSNTYLRPILESFGFSHPEAFFAHYLERAMRERPGRTARFASLGCGNCDAEIRIAQMLVARGCTDFRLECMDINPAMLARGREAAQQAGLSAQVVPVEQDFNHWHPAHVYDAVMANQSLHHMLELERVFDNVAVAIGEDGVFLASDMIGRNGHRRWPEALAIVREFWRELPTGHRYNLQLRRQEDDFLDWDCSVAGFEGIRAQDILPLLVERFGFELFVAWGNVIDPFIDRGFGHHFDAAGAWDRGFIDRVHARDVAALRSGEVKPTHLIAVMRNDRSLTPSVWENLTPAFSIRRPD